MPGFGGSFLAAFPVVAQLLLGGPPPIPEPDVRRDPSLPTGASLAPAKRPEATERAACSLRRPVCVQRVGEVDAQLALAALDDLENAYEQLVLVLGLPQPRRGWDGGGVDLYLDPAAGPQLETSLDPSAPYGFDSARLFCRVAPGPREAMQRAATLCLGEAIATRLDAALAPDLRRAYATYLWWTVGTPTPADVLTVDDAQTHPERALANREQTTLNGGPAALFFEYLDTHWGRGRSGWVPSAVLAAASGRTRGLTMTWNNEPDVFDVLRHTLDEKTGEFARLVGDFAVDRAFLGDRDDGTHWPRWSWPGAAGSVRFDWHLKSSSLPRRVAAARPIEPNGAMYVWLELDDIELGTTLGFQAQWEPPVAFQWNLVRVAKDGRELSRLVIPFKEQATEVTQTVTNLETAAGLLIVGTQLGGVDLLHPFDPDVAPYEAHSCTTYITKMK